MFYAESKDTRAKFIRLTQRFSEPARKEYEALSEHAELIEPKSKNRADFIKKAKSGALDGTVAIYRTFGSASITGGVDEELVSALPKSLKFICHNGTCSYTSCAGSIAQQCAQRRRALSHTFL